MKKKVLKAALLAATVSATGLFALTSFAANPKITQAHAKEIAVARAGIPMASANFKKVKLEFERDRGRYEYDVEFLYNGYEYDVEIDAETGAVVDYDVELDD